MITNEEDEESESCLDREMLDNTEGEIVANFLKIREKGLDRIVF